MVKNEKDFKDFVSESPVEILEYLIVEKGMEVEYFSHARAISYDVMKVLYKVKGLEIIQKMDPRKFPYDFQTLKFLRSIGYEFDKKSIQMEHASWIYSLICFKVFKYEDLGAWMKEKFWDHIKDRDIKACKHMYSFMKEIRKKKIMTILCCVRKRYPYFQKEIIWNILDHAYSPINERGSS